MFNAKPQKTEFRNNLPTNEKKKPPISLVYDYCFNHCDVFFFRFTGAKIGVVISYFFLPILNNRWKPKNIFIGRVQDRTLTISLNIT